MKFQRSLLASAFIAGTIGPAAAFAPDGCEQQRAQYPANWNDTSHEKPLFTCSSHYNDPYRVKIGDSDGAGRTMMSLVPLSRPDQVEKKDGILRIWLDKEQAQYGQFQCHRRSSTAHDRRAADPGCICAHRTRMDDRARVRAAPTVANRRGQISARPAASSV